MHGMDQKLLALLPPGHEAEGLAAIAFQTTDHWPTSLGDLPGGILDARLAAMRLLPTWAPQVVLRKLGEDLGQLLAAVRPILNRFDDPQDADWNRLSDLHYELVCRWLDGPATDDGTGEAEIPGIVPKVRR